VLEAWAASGKKKALLCLGRRSGKGLMAAVAAIHNATMPDYSDLLRPGEARFIIVVANRDEQAQEFVRVVRELLRSAPDEDLTNLVDWDRCTLSEIVFTTGAVIRAMPCSSRSTRGLAISLLVMDEAAFMKTDSEGFSAGKQVYQALSPSTAQFGEMGYTMLTSTPNWRSGIFWDLYRAGTEGQDEDLLVVQRPTWEMNPRITRASLEREFRANPDWAATEYGADFTAASGAFLDIRDILACKRESGTLPPHPDHKYKCAIDPAFARDAFAMAIAHREKDTVIVDGVWTWSRAGFERTLDEVVSVAQRYGVKQVRTDQYSSQPVLEGLQRRRIECEAIPWDNANKFEAFTRLKAGITTRQVSLPNDDDVVNELQNLEAKPTVTGMTRIAASAGNHDDRATVLAALMDLLEGGFGPIVIDRTEYHAVASIFDWGDGGFLPD
jgi:phage terminase large subunit-like protein